MRSGFIKGRTVKEYMKEYFARPEVKEHMKEYYARPEVKEHIKEYEKERNSIISYTKKERTKFLLSNPIELDKIRSEIMRGVPK